MLTLDEIQAFRVIYIRYKRQEGEFMTSGSAEFELEQWTIMLYNIVVNGYSLEDIEYYLGNDMSFPNWIS